MKAYDALLMLARDGGLLHNDIRSDNFGMFGDKVFVIDLEDVGVCEKSKLKKYKYTLGRLFPDRKK